MEIAMHISLYVLGVVTFHICFRLYWLRVYGAPKKYDMYGPASLFGAFFWPIAIILITVGAIVVKIVKTLDSVSDKLNTKIDKASKLIDSLED